MRPAVDKTLAAIANRPSFVMLALRRFRGRHEFLPAEIVDDVIKGPSGLAMKVLSQFAEL